MLAVGCTGSDPPAPGATQAGGVSAPRATAVSGTDATATPPDARATALAPADADGAWSWATLPPLPAGPRQETAVVALGDTVYVLGGFDGARAVVATVEAFDTSAGTWRRVADLPVPVHHANAAAVDGRLFVAGSLTGAFVADGRVFAYDPATDRWSERMPMPAGSERGAAAVALIDGRIVVAGGLRGGAVADVSAYDAAADTWSVLQPLPEPRDHAGAGVVDGVLYVAGGRGGAIDAHSPSLLAYDAAADRWTVRAEMPTSRGGIAAAVAGGLLVVIGGEGNRAAPSGVFAAVEAYDPAADSWRTLAPMPVPRHGTGAAAVDGVIYVPGGATVAGFGAVDTVEALRLPRSR